MKKSLTVIFFLMFAFSCSDEAVDTDETGQADSESTAISDIKMNEWVEYLQSSDTGLWEDQENKVPHYVFLGLIFSYLEILYSYRTILPRRLSHLLRLATCCGKLVALAKDLVSSPECRT